MDLKTLTMALLAAAGSVAAIALLGALVLRRASPGRQAAVMPLALAAGFVLGYACFFDWPRKLMPELWQTTVFVAILAGVLSSAMQLIRRRWVAWTMGLVMVVCCTLVSLGGKHGQIGWHGLGLVAGVQLVTMYALGRLERSGAPVSGVPLAFGLSCAAAAFVVFYAADFILPRLFMVLGVMMGVCVVLGLWGPAAGSVRGAVLFPAVLYGVMVAISAYYVDAIPRYAFGLLAGGPLAACVGYVPALQGRKWWCLGAVALVAAACLVPAVIVTIHHAPVFE